MSLVNCRILLEMLSVPPYFRATPLPHSAGTHLTHLLAHTAQGVGHPNVIYTHTTYKYVYIHILLFNLYAAYFNHAYECTGNRMAQAAI